MSRLENKLLTVLQAVPQFHIQTAAGKPGPAGNPQVQRDTKYRAGRTGSNMSIIQYIMKNIVMY